MGKLPTAQEQVKILEASGDRLIQHHFGLRPDELDRTAYCEALEKARRRESPSPPPRRRRRTTRHQVARRARQKFEEDVAAQLFVTGALLEIAGDDGVDRVLLAMDIVRLARGRHVRRNAGRLKR